MKQLKIAVVGLGRIGWYKHIPEILAHSEQFDLVAVVDTSAERLEEAQSQYGVRGYISLKDMIQAENPDVVVIASPNHLHEEHACTAMEMGCDVFLEKPMAHTYESAKVIADCVQKTGKKLMVFQPRRASAATNQLMEIIDSGKIGKLSSIQVTRCGYVRRADWQAYRKFGGGMINNYGPHYIDGLLHLIKEPIQRVFCTANVVASAGDAEDVVKILMESESGIVMDIDINQAAAISHPEWLICGQYGAIISEGAGDKQKFRIRYYDPNAIPAIAASDDLAAKNRSYNNDVEIPWAEEIVQLDPKYEVSFYDKLYEYIALDQPSYVPVEESLYVMELVHKCRKDAGIEN